MERIEICVCLSQSPGPTLPILVNLVVDNRILETNRVGAVGRRKKKDKVWLAIATTTFVKHPRDQRPNFSAILLVRVLHACCGFLGCE